MWIGRSAAFSRWLYYNTIGCIWPCLHCQTVQYPLLRGRRIQCTPYPGPGPGPGSAAALTVARQVLSRYALLYSENTQDPVGSAETVISMLNQCSVILPP